MNVIDRRGCKFKPWRIPQGVRVLMTSFQIVDSHAVQTQMIVVRPLRDQGVHHEHRHGKVVQCQKGFGFIQTEGGGPDVFVHISAVERSGLYDLREGQKLNFEVIADQRTGKSSAEKLQAA